MEDKNENRPDEKHMNTDYGRDSTYSRDPTSEFGGAGNSQTFERQQFPSHFHRTDCQYKNAKEYAQTLQAWLWQYRFFSAMNTFHYQLLSSMPSHFTPQHTTLDQGLDNLQSRLGQQSNAHQAQPQGERLIPPNQRNADVTGTRYKVPMLWRRIAAECLDFILLFYIKLLVTVAVLRQMGYMNENFLDLDDQIPLLSDLGDLDYDRLLGFTSELIALEVVNRVCITLVETLCLRQGYAGSIGGATPGKKIMQLRVISYNNITDLRNGQILVTGERDPGFFNALVRSVIKNFSMAFFFPACFTVFFFRFNRAAYDVLAQTIVVEVERQPQPN